jgi:anti-sigma regulatory factor (Ser/Thr protein kinase)
MHAWMAGLEPLLTIDEASVSVAREAVRAAGAALGLDRELIEAVAIAASELTTNQLCHARRGQIAVRAIARGGVPGLEVIAADHGNGIPDPALAGPGPSSTSLGAGLSGARRMTQEMDVDVRWGQGTCVRVRAFAQPVPRRREVGVVGRPFPEERGSGDHAVFTRDGDVLLCAVIDGIGHGPLAADAAERAGATILEQPRSGLDAILAACDAALVDTRGAVAAVARIDETAGTIEHAGIGNITSRVERYRDARVLLTTPSALGRRGPKRKPVVETTPIAPDQALILYTDGLTSRASAAQEGELLHEHPVVIAQWLFEEFARDTDDALVLVAR